MHNLQFNQYYHKQMMTIAIKILLELEFFIVFLLSKQRNI